jgi:hypothetical protein
MSTSRQFPIAPGRKMGAWVCLVAALLLWSPLWAAAIQAAGMSCCEGGMCPAHHHQPRQADSQETPMTCEHNGASQCSMSHSQSEGKTFVAAMVFILPAALLHSRLSLVVTPLKISVDGEIPSAVAPPDHPPRLLSS